jgi:outer membrane protein
MNFQKHYLTEMRVFRIKFRLSPDGVKSEMCHFFQNMLRKERGFKKYRKGPISILFLVFSNFLFGQSADDTLLSKAKLSQCITYALANQPLIKQSLLDEDITRRDMRITLSGWYPQLEVDVSLQHYLQVPLAYYPNLLDPSSPEISFPSAATNVSSAIFSANQTLYSSNLLFAARASKELHRQASENTVNSKINTCVDVTKAFFDVLLTEEQIKVLNEDILRLQRNYKDAYNLYQDGLTDKIDYQRTEISLNNAQAQRKSTEEGLKAKYSILKQIMGMVPAKQLTVSYDSSRYENEILFDTAKNLDYNKRIEYKLLQTSLNLQNFEIGYYRWSFLPNLSAFYDYNLLYQKNQFSELYNKSYPTSLFGLKLTLPLFQGMKRMENLSKAKLQYQRIQLGMDYLKSEMNSEYTLALSGYTSNLNELRIAKKNITIAKDIFNTVKFQYDKGIKSYLEVIVSETDLRNAELNYLTILFQVLTSKMDLEKALGEIKIN